jgi:hypothetical protein
MFGMRVAIDHPAPSRIRTVFLWLGMVFIFVVLPIAVGAYVVYWASEPGPPDVTPVKIAPGLQH